MSGSGTVLRNKTRAHKLCEGWLEYKCHKPGGSRWEEIWVVLKGNIFYIFKNTDTTERNQMGNLTIDSETTFTKRKDDSHKGFKFELSTGKRINMFKSKKFSERELWRAYIIGVTKGKLPDDIDLLNVDEIQHNLDLYLHGPLPQPPKHRESTFSEESGVGSICAVSGFSVPYPSNPSLGSRGTSGSRGSDDSHGSGSRGGNRKLDNGGPTMVHKFYDDRSRDQQTPSWFFHHCSRQLAESVLKAAAHHGNTLMRESTSHKDNGSYVISKLIWNERRRTEPVFEHYEVMRTAKGYKVNVENPHDPMKCLAHVMEYFMQTSGVNTQPMETNDMKVFGLETPDYETTINRRTEPQPEPWVWPPPAIDSDSGHDYEDQNTARSYPSSRHSREQAHTVSPGILKKQANALPKTVGFSHQSKTNSSIHHTHAGSGRSKYSAPPSMQEMAQRSNAAEQLRNLDDVIASHDMSGFEHGQIYVNEQQNQEQYHEEESRQRSTSYSPPPPPPDPTLPTPHRPLPQHSYVNDNDTESSATLDALPVAPPAPRDPISVNRSPSTASSESRSRFGNNSPVTTAKPPLRSISSPTFTASSAQPITTQRKPSPARQPVKNNSSVGQFTGINSTRSPSKFPTWSEETNKTPNVASLGNNTNKINNAVKSPVKSGTIGRVVSEPILPGVDDTNPGGVSDLRSKFEVKAPANTRHSANVTPVRKRSDVCSSRDIGVGVDKHKGINKRVDGVEAEGNYDDTANPIDRNSMSGLDVNFKNKLEGLFGGGSTGPIKSPTGGPKKQFPRQQSSEDHEYAELPDGAIEPDDVTYVNDEFNIS